MAEYKRSMVIELKIALDSPDRASRIIHAIQSVVSGNLEASLGTALQTDLSAHTMVLSATYRSRRDTD